MVKVFGVLWQNQKEKTMDDKPLIDIDNKKEEKPDLNITIDKVTPDVNIIAPEFDTVTESFAPTEIAAATEIQQVEERLSNTGVLSADLIAEVKRQVTAEIMADLKEDNTLKSKETELRRELEDIEYANYVALKMESDDPWVDFVGEVRDTEKGQRLELNWNPAFVVFLKSIGITGIDDEQMVQKYISLLLRDMVDKNEERYGSDYE